MSRIACLLLCCCYFLCVYHRNDITACIKIDKPLVVTNIGNAMCNDVRNKPCAYMAKSKWFVFTPKREFIVVLGFYDK